MNQEPGLTDEVVMIFVDSEIVNDGEALDRGNRLDRDPAAILRFQAGRPPSDPRP